MPDGSLRLSPLPSSDPRRCRANLGAHGCGQCAACKANRRKALGKVDAETPYLGPIPFKVQFPKPREGVSIWLTDHWPSSRLRVRAAMLADLGR